MQMVKVLTSNPDLITNLSAFIQVNKTGQEPFPGPDTSGIASVHLIQLASHTGWLLHFVWWEQPLVSLNPSRRALAGTGQTRGEYWPSHNVDDCKLVLWSWSPAAWWIQPYPNFPHPEVAQLAQARGRNSHQGSSSVTSRALEG